jgi:hypothetical protein
MEIMLYNNNELNYLMLNQYVNEMFINTRMICFEKTMKFHSKHQSVIIECKNFHLTKLYIIRIFIWQHF